LLVKGWRKFSGDFKSKAGGGGRRSYIREFRCQKKVDDAARTGRGTEGPDPEGEEGRFVTIRSLRILGEKWRRHLLREGGGSSFLGRTPTS